MFWKMPVYQKFFKQNDVLQLQGRFPLKCFYMHCIQYNTVDYLCWVMSELEFHVTLNPSICNRRAVVV